MEPPRDLMEELVEQILLCFPPDDPATLVNAALVCKFWCRLVCSAAFHRRFRELHGGAAPVLGFLYGDNYKDIRHDVKPRDTKCPVRIVRILRAPTSYAHFVPTTSFRPEAHVPVGGGQYGWRAIDARHGRVLLYRRGTRSGGHGDLCVWDPITDEQRILPKPMFYPNNWTAAVACAAISNGNCDHLDCHRGPFLVVFMDINYAMMIHLSVYSSEAGAWSNPITCKGPTSTNSQSMFKNVHAVSVHSTLYFLVHHNLEIVKYDLTTGQVSMIHIPSKFRRKRRSIVLMPDDDGELGFVSPVKYKLELWSSVVAGADGDADFVLRRVIDLQKVLPSGALIRKKKLRVNGFADGGASRVLFIRTCNGLYTVEINSSQVKKVANCCDGNDVVPYISFCTPTSRVQH